MTYSVGLMMFATAATTPMPELAVQAEERGFDSLFLPEHPVIPETFTSEYPGGGPLPDEYKRMIDPYVGLAAAAGATTHLKLGTAISLILERHPLLTAKAIASLDRISNGRVVLGVGSGWLKEEADLFDVDWARRGAQLKDYVLALQACWSDGPAEYDGSHISFPPLIVEPKPVQKPFPPVLIAGEMKRAARRAAEWGAGWIPRYLWSTPETIREGRTRMETLYRERGRDPDTIDITLFGCRQNKDEMQHWKDAGVTRFLFVLPTEQPDDTTRRMDRIAERILA